MFRLFLGLVFLISSCLATGNEQKVLCTDKRLTPANYPFKLRKIHKKLKSIPASNLEEKLNQLMLREEDETELCAWNQFLAVDFLIYFDLFKKVDLKKEISLVNALELRDRLYQKWLEKNKRVYYADYANTYLTGKTLNEFLQLPSEKFSYITKPLKFFNRRPKKNKAKSFIYDLIEARSPFNSIFTHKAVDLLLERQTNHELNCLLDLKQNLINDADQCVESKDRLITLLGVLSSQRMYLIRDLASFMQQNLIEPMYRRFYENAALSSLLYFKLETYAHKYGVKKVYPVQSEVLQSPKPYHFYSVAYISSQMEKAGFNDLDILENANFYAKKYKANIKLVGLVYNTIAGIPLKNGSVGDKKQILNEQNLAIKYVLKLINEDKK